MEAQRRYGKLVQVGDQQRSSPHTIKIIGDIHDGRIGRAYFARSWYVNTRKSMGIGKVVPVPDAELGAVQGPAPRSEYKDNIHPYNWHWLRRYGTGEALNNGRTRSTSAMGARCGVSGRVTAAGGRYQYTDDWQFPDTLVTSFTYPDQMITWEGRELPGDEGVRTRPRVADPGHEGIGAGGSRRVRGVRLDGQEDGRVQDGKQTSSSDLLAWTR